MRRVMERGVALLSVDEFDFAEMNVATEDERDVENTEGTCCVEFVMGRNVVSVS